MRNTFPHLFVLLMLLIVGASVGHAQFFADIPETDPEARVITEVAYHQLMEGYPEGVFRPEEPLRLAEGVMVYARLLNVALRGFMVLPGVTPPATASVPDPVPTWANPAAEFLLDQGMWPYERDQWRLDTPLTRGEFAQGLFRLLHAGASCDERTAITDLRDADIWPAPWEAVDVPLTRRDAAILLDATLVHLTQHAVTEGTIAAFETDKDGTRWVHLRTAIGEGRLCLPVRGVVMEPAPQALTEGMRIRTLSDAVASSRYGTFFRVRAVTILPEA